MKANKRIEQQYPNKDLPEIPISKAYAYMWEDGTWWISQNIPSVNNSLNRYEPNGNFFQIQWPYKIPKKEKNWSKTLHKWHCREWNRI